MPDELASPLSAFIGGVRVISASERLYPTIPLRRDAWLARMHLLVCLWYDQYVFKS